MDMDKFRGKVEAAAYGFENYLKKKLRTAKDDFVMEHAERGVPIAIEEAKRRGLIPRD